MSLLSHSRPVLRDGHFSVQWRRKSADYEMTLHADCLRRCNSSWGVDSAYLPTPLGCPNVSRTSVICVIERLLTVMSSRSGSGA